MRPPRWFYSRLRFTFLFPGLEKERTAITSKLSGCQRRSKERPLRSSWVKSCLFKIYAFNGFLIFFFPDFQSPSSMAAFVPLWTLSSSFSQPACHFSTSSSSSRGHCDTQKTSSHKIERSRSHRPTPIAGPQPMNELRYIRRVKRKNGKQCPGKNMPWNFDM